MPLCRMFEMPSMLKRWGEERGGGAHEQPLPAPQSSLPGDLGVLPKLPRPTGHHPVPDNTWAKKQAKI